MTDAIERVEVDVLCLHETRLSFGVEDPRRAGDCVWLRREDVRWPGRGFEREALRTIEIPLWLAKQWGFSHGETA